MRSYDPTAPALERGGTWSLGQYLGLPPTALWVILEMKVRGAYLANQFHQMVGRWATRQRMLRLQLALVWFRTHCGTKSTYSDPGRSLCPLTWSNRHPGFVLPSVLAHWDSSHSNVLLSGQDISSRSSSF